MKNISFERSSTNVVKKTISRLFSKKPKLSITLDQKSKVLYNLFLLYAKIQGYRNALKLCCRPIAFTSYKTCPKNKMRFGTSLPARFSGLFLHEAATSVFSIIPTNSKTVFIK